MPENKKNIVGSQLNVYRDNFLKHGDTPLGTRQNNRETQFLRFQHLIKNIHFPADEKLSIHDVGSGMCDFYEYLLSNQKKVEYSGTEIVQEMIDASSAKYPEIKLFNRDILSTSVNEKYDFVVLSGTFNMPGEISAENWREFVFSMIKKMFSMSTKGIAFNCLTTYKTLTDPSLFYISPEEIFSVCAGLSRFINIDQSYALYEYTVTVYQKEYMRNEYDQQFFAKYFK